MTEPVAIKSLLDQFVWQDVPPPPPRSTGRSGELYAIAKELRTRPGVWAIVRRRPKRQGGSLAASITRGDSPNFRPVGAFEAVGRTVDDEFVIWARYVGNGSE